MVCEMKEKTMAGLWEEKEKEQKRFEQASAWGTLESYSLFPNNKRTKLSGYRMSSASSKKKKQQFLEEEFYRTPDLSLARQDLCHMQILLHKKSNASSSGVFLFSADHQSDRQSKQVKKSDKVI